MKNPGVQSLSGDLEPCFSIDLITKSDNSDQIINIWSETILSDSIDNVIEYVKRLVPEASFAVVHDNTFLSVDSYYSAELKNVFEEALNKNFQLLDRANSTPYIKILIRSGTLRKLRK